MKKFFLVSLLLVCSHLNASELEVINYSKDNPDRTKDYFLFADSKDNYSVKYWQVDLLKNWSGKGDIKISIDEAIDIAYRFLKKSKSQLGVSEVSLRPAFSREGPILWYYSVELAYLPYAFDSEKVKVVVLTSGRVLLPK
jgi:hypothetical protein